MMEFVHGTTSSFIENITANGLQPPISTSHSTERRRDRLDGVHIFEDTEQTRRIAGGYALRAVRHFGGKPVLILGEVPGPAIQNTLQGKGHFPDIHVVPYIPPLHITSIEELSGHYDLDISSMFKPHK